jgi:hypothetical protein
VVLALRTYTVPYNSVHLRSLLLPLLPSVIVVVDHTAPRVAEEDVVVDLPQEDVLE